jgi:hypothetical protein
MTVDLCRSVFKFGLCFLFLFSSRLSSSWVFSSRESKLRLGETNSKFMLSTAATGWDGTLLIKGHGANKVTGATITFEEGCLETNDLKTFLTAKYDPTGSDKLVLEGSDRMRAEPGTVLQSVEVQGTGNYIEGQPMFTAEPQFTADSAELVLSIQRTLNKSIDFNDTTNSTLKLEDNLTLGDGIKLYDSGSNTKVRIVDINGRTLNLPGSADSAWTDSLKILNANDITLNAKTTLQSEWHFSGAAGESNINGNGNILDLSSANAVIKVGNDHNQSHTLYITDCFLKGLGDATGTFSMMGPNSQVVFNNVSMSIAGDYTFDHGTMLVNGDNCNIITAANTMTFTWNQADSLSYAAGNDTKIIGSLTIDGVTLVYDTLDQSDADNIQPKEADSEYLILQNNGQVLPAGGAGAGGVVITSTPYEMTGNIDTGVGREIFIQKNGAPSLASIIDGQGYYIHFPSAYVSGSDQPIVLESDTTLEFRDVVLKDFDPDYIKLGASNSSVTFGDDVVIELARNQDLTVSWSFVGNATIDGQGSALNLNTPNAITVAAGKTLTLKDVIITGLQNGTNLSDYGRIHLHDDTSVLTMKSAQIVLAGDYTFSTGYFNIYEDCGVSGKDQVFTYSSGAQSIIQADATWRFDRNTTLSYEADLRIYPPDFAWTSTSYDASRNRIKLNTTTSRLFLDGCTLWSTHTGIYLDTGVLVVNDKVTLHSAAGVEEGIVGTGSYVTQSSGEEAEFNANLRIEMLSGAVLDIDGQLKYE